MLASSASLQVFEGAEQCETGCRRGGSRLRQEESRLREQGRERGECLAWTRRRGRGSDDVCRRVRPV